MKTISTNELVNLLVNNVKFATFAQIQYETAQKMKKTGNPFNEITKKTDINVSFFGSYEKAVNNRLKKSGLEADFTSNPLSWGQWVTPNKIIQHTDKEGNLKTYIRFYYHKKSNPKTVYFHEGHELTGERLESAKMFFQGHTESKRQSDHGLEAEDQCKPFTLEVTNIRQITINNETYEIN